MGDEQTNLAKFVHILHHERDFFRTQILSGLQSLWRQKLKHAQLSHMSPVISVRRECDILPTVHDDMGENCVWAGSAYLIMGLENFFGEVRRRDDYRASRS
jgi:hypothetical protein